MPSPLRITLAMVLVAVSTSLEAADDKAKAKVNFQDHVAAIFQSRCNSCHNADKAKGGLALETFAATMEGGGSGKVVEPGDLAGSHLWQLVSHAEEPKMPPSAPRIPDAELAILKAWIEAGAPESSGSVVAMKARPKFEFKLDPSGLGKPVGPPASPEGVSTEPVVLSPKANAIIAMAASPWAPLVAVAGHKQVLLYQVRNHRLVGVLPFPEGTVHVLKFSRNGSLLLAGGGRGGQSGLAVVFDVKTGKRVFEIGKEYDVVLAADISPDHGQVALGGPSKTVRVYNTSDGSLEFEMKKHTEWITALEFSPDGVLLATGDRNNGLIVWEAGTGREYFDLRGHTLSLTDVSWRLDSNLLASAAEDGTVRLWEMENGGQVKAWGAHGGGVASARFAKDGRIVTTGRDRVVRVWDQNGAKQKEFEPFGDLALRAVFADDDTKVVAGDWSGEVRVIDGKDGKTLANLRANPAPISARLEQAQALLQAARTALDRANKDLAPVLAEAQARAVEAEAARKLEQEAQQASQRSAEAVTALEKIDGENAALQTQEDERLKLARAALEKANLETIAAEKAIGETALAEKLAAEAIVGSRTALEKSLHEKVAQEPSLSSAVEALKSATTKAASELAGLALAQATARSVELVQGVAKAARDQVEAVAAWDRAEVAKSAAPRVLASSVDRAKLALDVQTQAQASQIRASDARRDVARALVEARDAAKVVSVMVDARKKERDARDSARLAAEKVLGERRAVLDGVTARLADLQAEVDALSTERTAAESARAGAAPASNPGS